METVQYLVETNMPCGSRLFNDVDAARLFARVVSGSKQPFLTQVPWAKIYRFETKQTFIEIHTAADQREFRG